MPALAELSKYYDICTEWVPVDSRGPMGVRYVTHEVGIKIGNRTMPVRVGDYVHVRSTGQVTLFRKLIVLSIFLLLSISILVSFVVAVCC